MFILLCFDLISVPHLPDRTDKYPQSNFVWPSLSVVYCLMSQCSSRNMLRLVSTLESKHAFHLPTFPF